MNATGTNYETWAVCFRLNNNQDYYEYWKDRAQEEFDYASESDDVDAISRNALLALAQELQNAFEDEDGAVSPIFYEDSALGRVSWVEVADNFLLDIEGYVKPVV